jgi:predicted DNA-binding transcriptional regulator YafY
MSRSTDSQKAERLNAAHGLLASRGLSVAEAAVSLSRQFSMSRRQAYRYIEEAQTIGRLVSVTEPNTAVTFKLPPSLVHAIRARAAAEGTTISDMVSRALRAFLGEAGGNG